MVMMLIADTGHPLGYPTLAASGLGHDIKVFMPVAKSACCLDHAERVMDKNTHTVRARTASHTEAPND